LSGDELWIWARCRIGATRTIGAIRELAQLIFEISPRHVCDIFTVALHHPFMDPAFQDALAPHTPEFAYRPKQPPWRIFRAGIQHVSVQCTRGIRPALRSGVYDRFKQEPVLRALRKAVR